MRRAGLAALAIALACATTGERPPPPAPPPVPSFRDVRSLVLVRSVDGRAGRPKDPLDGLEESLRARGYATRIVELGPRRQEELARLEALYWRLEARASTNRGDGFGAAPGAELGASAGEVVRALDVDAVASYHRLDAWRLAPPSTAPAFPGTGPTQPLVPRSAKGAFAIVDRAGRLAVFPWGAPSGLDDPSAPINAAEAIDQVVRRLTGEPAEPAE